MIRLGSIIHGMRKYSPVGLEIGDTSVRMAQLQHASHGWVIRDMISKEIAEPDDGNRDSRKDAIVRTIKDCIKESSFSGRSVVSVMPGYQLDILPVKLSLTEDQNLDNAVIEEAGVHLSYDIEDAVIDYIPIEHSGQEPESGGVQRTLLMSARREDVDEHLSILKAAKLKPLALDISACALSRVIGFSCNNIQKNVLIINAGELHTTLTLLWKDNILLDRNIIWGRENIEESLMNRLNLDRRKSAALLNRVGLNHEGSEGGSPEDKNRKQTHKISRVVYEILAAQLDKMAKEIEKVLQYFSSEMRGAKLDVIYLMGTVSTIRNLDTYLAGSTGIATEYFNPINAYDMGESKLIRQNDDGWSNFSVALGLAMRGFENQKVMLEKV